MFGCAVWLQGLGSFGFWGFKAFGQGVQRRGFRFEA